MSAPPAKQPNPVLELLLTIVLPSMALEWLSPENRIGPQWALVVASLIPLSYGAYCLATKQGLNFFSVFGLVAVLLNGGLGLLKLNAFWFATKEICIPVFLGIAFPLSHRFGKPLIEGILLAPHLINRGALDAALVTPEQKRSFAAVLYRASWRMGATMMLSAVANFLLALYLLDGKEPGSEAFVKGIGKLNWMGFIVIGLPLMGAMLWVLVGFLKAVQRLTGLERDDLLNPGTTVRKQVRNAP